MLLTGTNRKSPVYILSFKWGLILAILLQIQTLKLFTLFKEAQKWNVPGSVAGDDRGMREGVCVYVCVVLGQAPGLVSVM